MQGGNSPPDQLDRSRHTEGRQRCRGETRAHPIRIDDNGATPGARTEATARVLMPGHRHVQTVSHTGVGNIVELGATAAPEGRSTNVAHELLRELANYTGTEEVSHVQRQFVH
jgi:hypothetical protein